MIDRLNYLESQQYKEENLSFFYDLKSTLEDIYYPKQVDDISDMDIQSYEFLVALDNKGFFYENIEIENGIVMHTMDKEIENKDLHFLYVQISNVKPFIIRNIYKYLKGGDILEIFDEPQEEYHRKYFDDLTKLVDKYELIYVYKEDLKALINQDGKKISFYKKYFDEYAEE